MKNETIKHPTMGVYLAGYISSVILTLLAFGLTQVHISGGHGVISHEILVPALIGLAFIQLAVQLIFFLHLGQEKKPRWNFLFFASTFGLIILVVVASLWIMNHLNHYMTVDQGTEYILDDEGIHH